MVTWHADDAAYNHVSGFVRAGNSANYRDDAYLLLINGECTDTEGVTRADWPVPQSLKPDGLGLRAISARAAFTYTQADLNANPGKYLTATAFLAPASAWNNPNHVPNPAGVVAKATVVARSSARVTAPASQAHVMVFWTDQIVSDTKYWLVVIPTAVKSATSTPSIENDRYWGNVNTIGRGLSLWTDRRPNAPVITSPGNGTLVAAGGTLNLAITSNDPDAIPPGVGDVNTPNLRDYCGFHIQYAPLPTPSNPTPAWIDLPFYSDEAVPRKGRGWFIQQDSYDPAYYPGQPPQSVDSAANLFFNGQIGLACGAAGPVQNTAAIPAGKWQIRARTMDYGHPFSVEYGPLGKSKFAGQQPGSEVLYTYGGPNQYSPDHISDWSTPVTINVTARILPPLPTTPVQGSAVTYGLDIPFSWLYRNTAVPPGTQTTRDLQLRRLGSSQWHTFGAEPSADKTQPSYVLSPGGYSRVDLLYQSQWNILGGAGNPNPPLTDGKAVGVQRSGVASGAEASSILRQDGLVTPATGNVWVTLRGRYTGRARTAAGSDSIFVGLSDTGVAVNPTNVSSSGLRPTANTVVDQEWSWTGYLPANVDITRVQVTFWSGGPETFLGTVEEFIVTDSAYVFLETGQPYEWRVRTGDATGFVSDWSAPEPFWVVPEPASGEVRPLPDSTIEGATLGCGTYKAFIYRKGGVLRVGEVQKVGRVKWNRLRDDISDAMVEVVEYDIDCGNMLAKLRTWAYELVVFRDNGYSVDRVWEGPITRLAYEDGKVTIYAKDVMAYGSRRIIRQAMNDNKTGDSVVSRATRAIQNAFAADDPNILAYLTPLPRADDAKQYRSMPAYSRTVFEEVDDMAANAGLDYTCVGRAILLWGTKHRIGTLPELRDENLSASPIVSEYGMSAANYYAISDGNGLWGAADRFDPVSGNDPLYGNVEMLSSTWASDAPEDTGTYTQAGLETIRKSFEAHSERSISDRWPPPVVVRIPDNTSLHPDTVISIQHLVPGVLIPLRSTRTLRKVAANQKLDSVTVEMVADKETISVVLSPFSRDDNDVSEDTE